MSETHLANDPATRTPTGEIKDQTQPLASQTPATTEVKPDADKPAATTTPAIADDASKSLLNKPEPEGAPDKYEAFVAPEGYVLNDAAIAEAQPIFKELGLSQGQAQRLVDYYAKVSLEAAKAPMKAYEDYRAAEQAKVKADPTIGPRLAEVKVGIGRALDSLGDAALVTEFKAAMDLTGAGDNHAFVKVFDKFAKMVNEGKHVNGSNPSPLGQVAPGKNTKPSVAEAMYPNLVRPS